MELIHNPEPIRDGRPARQSRRDHNRFESCVLEGVARSPRHIRTLSAPSIVQSAAWIRESFRPGLGWIYSTLHLVPLTCRRIRTRRIGVPGSRTSRNPYSSPTLICAFSIHWHQYPQNGPEPTPRPQCSSSVQRGLCSRRGELLTPHQAPTGLSPHHFRNALYQVVLRSR